MCRRRCATQIALRTRFAPLGSGDGVGPGRQLEDSPTADGEIVDCLLSKGESPRGRDQERLEQALLGLGWKSDPGRSGAAINGSIIKPKVFPPTAHGAPRNPSASGCQGTRHRPAIHPIQGQRALVAVPSEELFLESSSAGVSPGGRA